MAALAIGGAEAVEGRTPGDVIYNVLEHLTSGEFKRFKNKLSDFSYQGGSSIPRGRLEHEDRIAVKDILVNVYGVMTALEVTFQVLKAIGFRGIAERLVKSIQTDLELLQISPEKRLEEYREHYIDHLKSKYSTFEERNARIGEVVCLQSRYTRLLIIKKHRNEVEREHEIRSCGRRHLQIMDNRSSHEYSPTEVDLLFSPDEHKAVPRTVVLQGPAGIGKTMTSQKIMLDWASGNLWQETFRFVFYLNCRKLNAITENISLAKLLCQVCHLNYEQGLLNAIFKEPEKLLFVIDGFDEFKCSVGKRAEVCENPFQEVPKQILLHSFLRKRILGGCSLIVTTRPFLLMNLQQLVKHPRYVEILGFTGNDRQEYCYNFFQDRQHASLALGVIMDNDTIFTMCAVPITCWIVCTVIKQKIERGVDVVNNCNTTTSIYLLYLKSLLTTRSNQVITCIKKLCALANEGVWDQKILFEEEDVQRHGLSLLDEESAFLIQNIFLRDIDIRTCYSFIHLSIQEFFAALYYVLVDESERRVARPADERAARSEIWTLSQLLKTSVGNLHLELTVQFLFGLVGDVHQTRRCLGCPLSFNEISVLETWLKNLGFSHSCRIFRLLYETDDANLIERTMSRFSHIDIKSRDYECRLSDMDYRTLAHCLKNSLIEHSIKMTGCVIRPKAQSILAVPLQKCSKLWFDHCSFLDNEQKHKDRCSISNLFTAHRGIQELVLRNCGLTSLSCEDLCSVIAENRSLIKLDLSENNLQDSGINLLHTGLKHRRCTIQELRLEKCGLTSSSCGFLCPVLRNPSLITLDLSRNDLQDSGIKCLNKILGHVRCSLQNLRLNKCGLSSLSCGGLSSVIITNRYLTTLDLENNNLQDIGIRRLLEGLKHADCTLQELRLSKCNLTYSCCYEIRAAIAANHSLIKLCLSYNNLMDSGIKLLCEGLRSPGCTLRELRLEQCGLTSHCYDDLKSVIKTNLFLTALHLNTDNIKSMRKEFRNLKRPPAATLDLRIHFGWRTMFFSR